MSAVENLLAKERSKALQTIASSKSSNNDKENHHDNVGNRYTGAVKKELKQASKAYDNVNSLISRGKSHNQRDRRPIDYNDSNLSYDEITISMLSNVSENSQQISFEPAEMTGRSTQCGKDKSRSCVTTNARVDTKKSSVDEILSSCFSKEARELRKSLNVYNKESRISMKAPESSRRSGSSTCSSFTNISAFSLPRTADLSCMSRNASLFGNESFAPAELMKSQLLNDEISWDQQCADIPMVALSDAAKQKLQKNSANYHEDDASLTASEMQLTNDSSVSVGKFFGTRSDSLGHIFNVRSPPKRHEPVKLISDDTVSTTTLSQIDSLEIPPDASLPKAATKTPNKTYKVSEMAAGGAKCLDEIENQSSDNSTDKSYMLSVSAINRALEHIDLEEDNGGGIFEKLMQQAKPSSKSVRSKKLTAGKLSKDDQVMKSTSPMDKHKEKIISYAGSTPNPNDTTLTCSGSFLENLSTRPTNSDESDNRFPLNPVKIIVENAEASSKSNKGESKERADCLAVSPSGGVKRATNNKSSGLSPCHRGSVEPQSYDRRDQGAVPRASAVRSPMFKVGSPSHETGNDSVEARGIEGDIDEWRCSPVVTPDRRKKRTKSPSSSPNYQDAMGYKDPNRDKPAVTSRETTKRQIFELESLRHERPKSSFLVLPNSHLHSQYHEDGKRSSSDHHDSGISPTLSKSSIQFANSHSKTLTPSKSASDSKICDRSSKFPVYDVSPLLSPGSSPAGSLQNVSEASNKGNGRALSVTPTRSCSSASLRSTDCYGQGVVRSISRCSNSSEFSHRDGKVLPLKATALKLSWGSTALRTVSRKSIQIKNTSCKRLVVRINIAGPGFQLANVESNILTLQQQECRTIFINFCPTVIGPAMGFLGFVPPKSKISFENISSSTIHDIDVCIPLYGYGGQACVNIKGLVRGPIGPPFLPMGNLHELLQPLERSIEIRNRGPLIAFAIIDVDSTGLPSLCSAFEFQPDAMLIAPGETVKVRLAFRPNREDFRKIKNRIKDVIVLAKMRIINGDEPNRQRMRRLVDNMPAEQRKKMLPHSLNKLWQKLPGEYRQKDLVGYDEDVELVQDLLTCMSVQEVDLTLNYDPLNESVAEISTIFSADSDSTLLFRTVCARSPTGSPCQLPSVAESLEDDSKNETIVMSVDGDNNCYVVSSSTREGEAESEEEPMNWSVSPESIEFDFRQQSRKSFLIRNNFKSRQYFSVNCNHSNVFHFTPMDGYVEPDGGQIEVEVREHHMFSKIKPALALGALNNVLIEVHMDNERLELPVRILLREF